MCVFDWSTCDPLVLACCFLAFFPFLGGFFFGGDLLGAWCCFRVLLVAFLQRQGYPGVEVDLDVDVDVWRLLTLAFAFAC